MKCLVCGEKDMKMLFFKSRSSFNGRDKATFQCQSCGHKEVFK